MSMESSHQSDGKYERERERESHTNLDDGVWVVDWA